MSHMLRALSSRNFRLYFSGQSLSLIGTWMTQVATSWLVYRLTHSAFLLGLTSFASQIPVFFFTAFAGVWIDRLHLHRLLILTQILAMLQSLTLAYLTLTHRINIPLLILLGFVQGLINVFDMPARQSFIVEMVANKNDLANAIALNSITVNATRLVGPAIAGLVIAAFGEGFCFLIDGLSYIAVIFSLMLMRIHPKEKISSSKSAWQDLKEGARYAFGFTPIRTILWFMTVFSLAGLPYSVLMPIFASETYLGEAHTLGFLMGAAGVGALLGALLLSTRKSILGLGKMIGLAGVFFSGGLIAFSFSKHLSLALVLLVFLGAGQMVLIIATNTILQTIVEDQKRGRVMSLYTLSFLGMFPLGSILIGFLAKNLGAAVTLRIDGVICLLGVLIFLKQLPKIRLLVRPIYVEKGILSRT